MRSKKWRKTKYVLFPEFDKNANLHYHGIFFDTFEIKCVEASNWWKRKFGYTKLELQLFSRENWFEYITKDYHKVGLSVITSI